MTDHPVKRRKKLIEVAIPLEAINDAAVQEKFARQSHPSTLHLWWARRPLAAARAVIFCQMVDDPSSVPEEYPTKESQDNERIRLFALISDLVKWPNSNDQSLLNRARYELEKSWRRTCEDNKDHPQAEALFNPNSLPAFHDPFAGGGALPLEAQRLGLKAYASDLNPVAVIINKAMIDIPLRFAGSTPVAPIREADQVLIRKRWKCAEGLAEDVRYYGAWMREEALQKLGDFYPKYKITQEVVEEREDLRQYQGQELNVIAWLWARTVKSPDPAFSLKDVPLISTYMLSTKPGKEAYVEPVIRGSEYYFSVKSGKPSNPGNFKSGTKVGRGGNFQCLLSGAPIAVKEIRKQGLEGTFGARMMAVVAEGERGRVFLSPNREHEEAATRAKPSWEPNQEINHNPRDIRTQLYGLNKYGDLFTARQLTALTTFSDLIGEAREKIKADFIELHGDDDKIPLHQGGKAQPLTQRQYVFI